MRKAFLKRLGLEAEDVLDAFLDEVLAFGKEGGIGLESFAAALKHTSPEIKREVELDRDEVRILTVHASKGLEARLVFLVDPCNASWTEKHRPPILPIGSGYLWLPSSENHIRATRQATETIREAAEEEYRRLLYVGMTRAADKLVVCGFRGINEPKYSHWHQMVWDALEPGSEPLEDSDGNVTGFCWRENRTAPLTSEQVSAVAADTSAESPGLPEWLTTPVPHEEPLPQPLTPSGAFAIIGETRNASASIGQFHSGTSRASASPAFAIQRGRAVHRLLEVFARHCTTAKDGCSDKLSRYCLRSLDRCATGKNSAGNR